MKSIKQKKDHIRSFIWLSLTKDTQDKLVELCAARSNNDILTDTGNAMSREDIDFCNAIHKSLGCKEGHYARLIFELENMTISTSGGIFESVKEYINKYRTIEQAAIELAKQKDFNRDSQNINL